MDESFARDGEGIYEILQNGAGEIMLVIQQRKGEPDNPHFVYDGGSTALLYRSRESSVFLGNINTEAHQPLKSVNEIVVAEVEDSEVLREYIVPVSIISDLKSVLN